MKSKILAMPIDPLDPIDVAIMTDPDVQELMDSIEDHETDYETLFHSVKESGIEYEDDEEDGEDDYEDDEDDEDEYDTYYADEDDIGYGDSADDMASELIASYEDDDEDGELIDIMTADYVPRADADELEEEE